MAKSFTRKIMIFDSLYYFKEIKQQQKYNIPSRWITWEKGVNKLK